MGLPVIPMANGLVQHSLGHRPRFGFRSVGQMGLRGSCSRGVAPGYVDYGRWPIGSSIGQWYLSVVSFANGDIYRSLGQRPRTWISFRWPNGSAWFVAQGRCTWLC